MVNEELYNNWHKDSTRNYNPRRWRRTRSITPLPHAGGHDGTRANPQARAAHRMDNQTPGLIFTTSALSPVLPLSEGLA